MAVNLTQIAACLALVLAPAATSAQEPEDDAPPAAASHRALNLTIKGFGLSIGNSARLNGLRINFQDYQLERVNGVNLTLWTPEEPLGGTVNGLAVGAAPGAD